MRTELIGRAPLPTRVVGPAAGGWWAQLGADLVLLDPALTRVARVPIGTEWTASHAVDNDLGAVAVSDRDAVRVIAADGSPLWSFPHEPCSSQGSCSFSADGRWVFATMPETWALSSEYEDVGPGGDGEDEYGEQLCAFDARTGQVARWWRLAVEESLGSLLHPHPSGAVMIDVGEGQEGSHIFHADVSAGLVKLPGTDRALAGLNPAGTAFLSWPRDGTGLVVHAYPDGNPLIVGPGLPDGEWYGPSAGYLGDELIFAETVARDWSRRRDLIITAGDLQPLEPVEYPASAPPVVETLAVGVGGTWLITTGTELLAWRLAR